MAFVLLYRGGVPGDPPHGYGFVSRGLPLHVADRLAALIIFMSCGELLRDCFIPRCTDTQKEKHHMEEKQEMVDLRLFHVQAHLDELQSSFSSIEELLDFCGFSHPDNRS